MKYLFQLILLIISILISAKGSEYVSKPKPEWIKIFIFFVFLFSLISIYLNYFPIQPHKWRGDTVKEVLNSYKDNP